MKTPQSLAIEIKDTIKPERMETIGKYGCCAFVLMWCLGIEPDDIDAVKTVNNMINAGVWSPYSLYSEEIATFGESDYDQKDSAGFINLYGLPIKVQAMVDGKK